MFNSAAFKYGKNLFIGMGAAFVIFGALCKIQHWEIRDPFFDIHIIVWAMVLEAIIFAFLALLPPDKEYHWERAYPELMDKSIKVGSKKPKGPGAVEKLNSALASNQIDDNLIANFSTNMKSLSSNIGKLTDAADVSSATSAYAAEAKAAAAALSEVKNAYSNAAAVATDLAGASEGTRQYYDQVQKITQNLAQLNTVYELELQDTNNHLKALNKFYGNLTNAVENLNGSVEDTKKYRENMAALSTNLSRLNNIYGGMINAMATAVK